MKYFHEYIDDSTSKILHEEVYKIKCWEESEFSEGIVEHMSEYGASIKASSLVESNLSVVVRTLIGNIALLVTRRLRYETTYFTVEALRYDTGVGLAIHNDYDYEGCGYPGGRGVIQFSTPALRGGELELYQQLSDQTFEPILTCETNRNHLVGFIVAEDSFHAVQPIESGQRISIVMNFWRIAANIPSALANKLWKIPHVTRSRRCRASRHPDS